MDDSNIIPFPGNYHDEDGTLVMQIEGSFADFMKEFFDIDIDDENGQWFVTGTGELLRIANDL